MRFFRLHIVSFLVLVFIVAALASQAARFLVVDEPEKSDTIVVLAGETKVRPARALELLRQGVAPRVFMDAETRDLIYDQRLTDIAQKYVNSLPEASRIAVCPIVGFSTYAEADDVSRCLQSMGAHRVLIVTSEFHTRRALLIFRHRLPQYQFSAAAARNPAQFGEAWWTNREWAKVTFDECSKMLWWEAVDRWR
ncbi:MAG TPA: YdcF family protein [Terriglobales bacterium]|jgi:vancomycin permeability regulator SanA|nr:YdcF family protein [Terriglobales bacterium]